MSEMENLSHLPYDVLVIIFKLLKKLEDFVSLGSVSKSLHAAAKLEYFEGLRLRQGTPYLMLPGTSDDIPEFYSLVEGESIVASVKVLKFNTKKCFESLGWLLVVEEEGSMSLLDPFSGNEILLPHQNTFPEYITGTSMDGYIFIQKMVLSARPNETSDFVLMVIADGYGYLAFWRLGDKTWNKINNKPNGRFMDVVYYGDGQYFAIALPGVVWVYTFVGNNNNVDGHMITRCESIVPDFESLYPDADYDSMNLYILKTVDDRLLMIMRSSPNKSEDGLYYITSKFQVFEVDIVTRKWKEIYSLGSMAVFLGHNSTMAVDAFRFTREVKIKANHIYFTDDDWEFNYTFSTKGGGKNIGVYNFETETVESIHLGERSLSLSKFCSSIWITPCF